MLVYSQIDSTANPVILISIVIILFLFRLIRKNNSYPLNQNLFKRNPKLWPKLQTN